MSKYMLFIVLSFILIVTLMSGCGSQQPQLSYSDGYSKGYQDGANAGTASSQQTSQQAYVNGYNTGYQDGINAGYNTGYQDGLNAGMTAVLSIWPTNVPKPQVNYSSPTPTP
jgi:flagellar biosynthesis/type III secretory pathway protein FliH